MNKEVLALWPELEWIQDTDLREKTAKTWELALERSEVSFKSCQGKNQKNVNAQRTFSVAITETIKSCIKDLEKFHLP